MVYLAIACAVAVVPIWILFGLVFDEKSGQNAGVLLGIAGLFCCAGGFNALWRMAWYVPQARRRLREYGADNPKFAKSMHRITPPNTTLITQAAVVVIALLAAY